MTIRLLVSQWLCHVALSVQPSVQNTGCRYNSYIVVAVEDLLLLLLLLVAKVYGMGCVGMELCDVCLVVLLVASCCPTLKNEKPSRFFIKP